MLAAFPPSALTLITYTFEASGGLEYATTTLATATLMANYIVPSFPDWRLVTVEMSSALPDPIEGSQLGGVGLYHDCNNGGTPALMDFVAYGNAPVQPSSGVSLTALDGILQGKHSKNKGVL